MYRLELKVPPPVVALCLAFLMWFAPSLGQPEVPLQVRVGMALVLVLIGQSISIAGMVAFRRARTTINPIKASAASSLVTTGVFWQMPPHSNWGLEFSRFPIPKNSSRYLNRRNLR